MIAVDRRYPPPAGKPCEFRFPTYRRSRLASGLELILAPRSGAPLAEALLLLPAGGERNPRERPGLSALTAALVDEGTARRTGLELALEIERLGASLATSAGWDAAQIELSLLASDLDVGLERLAEIAREPSFPESEVERLRGQWLADLFRRRDQPASLADEALQAQLYAGTPYEHRLVGTEQSLGAIARDEIAGFHEAGYRSRGATLLVGGEFDEERLLALVEPLFASWESSARLPAPAFEPRRPGTRRVIVVDLPHAAQVELRVGQVGVPKTHADRTRLGVLNALLGGKFTSRLMLNLRERHGYTYGVSSRFVDRRGPGPFVIAAAVGNDVAGAALGEIFSELDRLRAEAVEPDELRETRDYLTGVFPYTLQTMDGLLGRLADLAVYGLPDDYFETWLADVRSVGAEELLELAERHLEPELATIVAVGPAPVLLPQLARFGEIAVVSPADPRVD